MNSSELKEWCFIGAPTFLLSLTFGHCCVLISVLESEEMVSFFIMVINYQKLNKAGRLILTHGVTWLHCSYACDKAEASWCEDKEQSCSRRGGEARTITVLCCPAQGPTSSWSAVSPSTVDWSLSAAPAAVRHAFSSGVFFFLILGGSVSYLNHSRVSVSYGRFGTSAWNQD